MRLAQELERGIGAEESLFRAQFMREDLARLGRVREIAAAAGDRAAFFEAARRLGWTQGDQRTHEILGALDAFLGSVFDFERGDASEASEERINAAWVELTRMRLEQLVGCLSMRVPKPAD